MNSTQKCQLIYFEGCPKAKEARSFLSSIGVAFETVLQDQLEQNDPRRAYSSPSILKGRKLIFGQKLSSGSSACSFEKLDEQRLKKVLLDQF